MLGIPDLQIQAAAVAIIRPARWACAKLAGLSSFWP